MLAALGAELHLTANDSDAARSLLARARSSLGDPAPENNALCRLTLGLLSELLGCDLPDAPKIRLSADLVDAVFLERGVQWWMIRLATRLLISKYYRAVALYDRRDALRTARTAVALGERVPTLPEREEFDLRLLTAHVDWSEHGLTARAESALVGNYLSATANGWLPEVAQVASLLASMMIIAGKQGAENYTGTALALAGMLEEDETARFTYLNFAAAELDAGRPESAATYLAQAVPENARGLVASECDAEYALLAREVKATARSHTQLAVGDRKGADRLATLDPLRSAYLSRVAAIELERRDDHRAATRLIAEAWEIAAHQGDWFSHRTIGRTYRKLTRTSRRPG
ncbi:MAG TPA: hypothetical protein VHT92_07695 [Candidatus Cybelea sp.]|nr:hypothetical protein [Candidatus Cybelea sp.]